MTGQALVVQGDALHLPLPDGSVDLCISSPPYFALRSYSTLHKGQEIGSEPTPAAYLEALWAATAEMVRVLKPTGSIFVDLGDKYNTQAGNTNAVPVMHGNGSRATGYQAGQGRRPAQAMPHKSLMLLPERYRVGCVDRLGLIARAVIVWDKPNGLPESVQDRVRRSHEDWVHLTRQPRYYSAIDEVREPYGEWAARAENWTRRVDSRAAAGSGSDGTSYKLGKSEAPANPLGKLPGSVWSIPSEPLDLPGYFVTRDGALVDFIAPTRGRTRPKANGNGYGLFDPDAYAELVVGEDAGAWRWLRSTGVNASPWPKVDTGLQLHTGADHYAAFPSRWPEQLIKGFSPPGICLECGAGRVPVVERQYDTQGRTTNGPRFLDRRHESPAREVRAVQEATILGYACSCTPFTDHPGTGDPARSAAQRGTTEAGRHNSPWIGAEYRPVGPWREYHLDGWQAPPTRPAVVLDSFGGTGTVAMVARALDRIGISVDLSFPYCRAARWRVHHDAGKAISRTNLERQQVLL